MGAATLAVNDDNFDTEVEKHNGVAVVDFWATWCGPCRMIAPALEELAKELTGKVKITKLDIDESPRTFEKFGVQGVPTLILFKNGQEVDRVVGAQTKSQLKNWMESHAS